MNKPDIYISIDVEADGPAPGLNSMLSFGAAAFDLNASDPRTPIATFEANLDTIMGSDWPLCRQSKATMDWWATQPKAWAACRENHRPPAEVMPEFVAWVRGLPGGNPTVVGLPVTYDFMFLYWYTMVFGGLADGERCPYGFQGLDIKTLASEKLGLHFKQVAKRRMPKAWFKGAPKHDHVALTDAIGQGVLYVNMKLGG